MIKLFDIVKNLNNKLVYLIVVLMVFMFYAHTLNYPWRYFDERIIYDESILPIPRSFLEILDYIKYFGIHNHFEASNPFYSTISNLRGTPLDVVFNFIVFLCFKKNPFNYHLFSLILHILNSFLLCLILLTHCKTYIKKSLSISDFQRKAVVIVMTLGWAFHPTNIESILFATNFGALITYFLCLLVIFYYLKNSGNKTIPIHLNIILFLYYLFPLFLNEYSVTLPIIVFCYLIANYYLVQEEVGFKNHLISALKQITPLLISLMIFVIYFFSLPAIRTTQEKNLIVSLERVFWFAPQVFMHYIKLILFPLHLTIDQTGLVQFSESLFKPYAIFCSITFIILCLFLLISFFNLKKNTAYLFFIIIGPFFISLLPFLHVLSPTYCIASERYLYFPLLLLTIGITNFLFLLLSSINKNKQKLVILVTVLLVTLTSCRAYARALDWKDSYSLFTSALKEAPNDLFKALRLEFLGSILFDYSNTTASKQKGQELLTTAIDTLYNSLLDLEYKKLTYQNQLTLIIKSYGLDPKTMQAKVAYLLAFTKIGIDKDSISAYQILKPHMEDLSIIDTQIIDLYLGLLFNNYLFDKAEEILNKAIKHRISPTTLTIMSQLQALKYKDMKKAEHYLKASFKLFPYDVQTLTYLKSFYQQTNNYEQFAYYSFLYGIRMHSIEDLKNSYKTYVSLNNTVMAKKSLEYISSIDKAN